MSQEVKKSHVWLVVLISLVALVWAFFKVPPGEVIDAFVQADYLLVAGAVGLQLMVIGAIALRWRLIFSVRPRISTLFNALLIAQLANSIIPLRVGILIRAFLVGKSEGTSKIMVLSTVLVEKVFESFAFLLLFITLLPVLAPVAPEVFQLSALRWSVVLFIALFPLLVIATYQRQRVLKLVQSLMGRLPWSERLGLLQKFETGLEGLEQLKGKRSTALLWIWTLLIAAMGMLVNYTVLQAFGIQVPVIAAAFVLVVLQLSSRVLPVTSLAGIGVFPNICVFALKPFSVDPASALSFGLMLYFVVFIPGSMLGALALYRTHYSLRHLQTEVQK
jgi:uncharacterized protein (TIRG00374 family)